LLASFNQVFMVRHTVTKVVGVFVRFIAPLPSVLVLGVGRSSDTRRSRPYPDRLRSLVVKRRWQVASSKMRRGLALSYSSERSCIDQDIMRNVGLCELRTGFVLFKQNKMNLQTLERRKNVSIGEAVHQFQRKKVAV
jgi:hypothetical protein